MRGCASNPLANIFSKSSGGEEAVYLCIASEAEVE